MLYTCIIIASPAVLCKVAIIIILMDIDLKGTCNRKGNTRVQIK